MSAQQMIDEDELEEDTFTTDDTCGECEDQEKCVRNQGCILEDQDA